MKERLRANHHRASGEDAARPAPGKRTRTQEPAARSVGPAQQTQPASPAPQPDADGRDGIADWLTDASLLSALGLGGLGGLGDDRPEDRYHGAQPAETYLAVHREKLLAAIERRLASAPLPAPHPQLPWAVAADALAERWRRALLEVNGGAFDLTRQLPAFLYPVDPRRVIDQHRALEAETAEEPDASEGGAPKGSLEWEPVAGAALALEVEGALRRSLPRMGLRYLAQLEEGGGQVSEQMLVTSHPMDQVVAKLLCMPGSLGRSKLRGGAARSGTDRPEAFKQGLRLVELEWQGGRDPRLWNWVRAVAPSDASREEVAAQVFPADGVNNTQLAYMFSGSAPLFQLTPRWALQVPGAREHAPPELAAQLARSSGGDDELAQQSALALADSALADELAEQQASHAAAAPGAHGAPGAVGARPKQAKPAPSPQALTDTLTRSAALLTQLLEALAPWQLSWQLGPALRWIERHRDAVMSAPDETLRRWALVAEPQLALLSRHEKELRTTLATYQELAAQPTAAQARPVRRVIEAYALTFGQSHLVEAAEAQLAVATQLSAELPMELLALAMREARRTTHEAQASAPGGASGGGGDPRMASQLGMEHSQLAMREAALRDGRVDLDGVEALAVAAAEAAHRNRIDALAGNLDQLQLAVEAGSDGMVATLANAFHSSLHALPATIRRIQRGARKTVADMDARTHAWLAAHAAEGKDEASSARFSRASVAERHRNLDLAKQELQALVTREHLDTFFQAALDTVKDARLYTLIAQTALLIGVAAAGAFAGGAMAGVVRGAMLADAAVDGVALYRGAMLARGLGTAANLATDASINALGQTLIGSDDSTGRAFAVNLLSSAAVIATLRPLHQATKGWSALEDQAHKLWSTAGGKRVLAQGAVLTAEMITAAGVGYAVEKMVPRKAPGAAPPSEDEALSWILQGAAMAVGRFVNGRLGGLQERLALLAERGLHLRKRAAAQARLADALEHSGDSAAALHLLDDTTALLREEAALLADRPLAAEDERAALSDPEAARAADAKRAAATAQRLGLDAKQLATLRAGNAAALADTRSSSIDALRLHFAGLEPLSDSGTLWTGTAEQIRTALESAGPDARGVHHNPARGSWTLELGGQRITLAEVGHSARPPSLDQQMTEVQHAQVDLHNHFMGNVAPESFARELAASGQQPRLATDVSEWEPMLREIVALSHSKEGQKLVHQREAGRIKQRGAAGDALEVAQRALERIKLMKRRGARKGLAKGQESLRAKIDDIAYSAIQKCLRASDETDFNSSYEIRDELVKKFYGAADRQGVITGGAPLGESRTKLLQHFEGRPAVLAKIGRAIELETSAKAETTSPKEKAELKELTSLIKEQFAYDAYALDTIVRLAKDRITYTEQSNSIKKLQTRFDSEQLAHLKQRAKEEHPELATQIEALKVTHLAMITTNHFGDRDADARDASAPSGKSSSRIFDAAMADLREVMKRHDIVGMDVAGLEHFRFDQIGKQRFQALFEALRQVAIARRSPVVMRPHVGEGAIDTTPGDSFSRNSNRQVRQDTGELTHYARARDNVDLLLQSLEAVAVQYGGELPPEVIVRFGHVTHATSEQAARMKKLGVIAEVNLTSNQATGALAKDKPEKGQPDQVSRPGEEDSSYQQSKAKLPKLRDHSLPTLIFNEVEVVLSTDGHEVMDTSLRNEFLQASEVLLAIQNNERRIRITPGQAKAMNREGGRARLNAASDGQIEVRYDELSPAKKALFDRAQRKFFETARNYRETAPAPRPVP